MTDVGKISLGVEIDASDLSARLGEAVRRAIAPALAQITAELQAVQHEYDQTGKAAERSAARQVASLKLVERQADATRRALERARAAAFGPGGGGPNGGSGGGGGPGGGGNGGNRTTNNTRNTVNNRTTNNTRNVTNNRYDNRSITNNKTDNRIDRRVINNYHYDNRTYNGGGGGGPGGGNNRRGGGGGGALGFITSPLGLNALAAGAAALPAVATGVTNIVGAVQQLGQAGLALPGIFAGGAAVIGTAVIGLQGIGDAVKALNEADTDPAKLAEANKQLEKMAPAAAAVAREVSKLSLGPLKEFQKAIAQPLLDGVDKSLDETATKVLPRIQPGMQKVAGALNGAIKTALSEAGGDKNLGLIDTILGDTAGGVSKATAAIKPALSGVLQLAREGTAFLPRLGDAVTKVAQRFEAFVSKNAANGNIFRWIDEGLNGLRSFGNAILNVGKIITGLTRAAGQAKGSLSGDGGLLGGLERFTTKWSNFVNSAQGQNKIGDFFRDGTGDLHRYGDLLKELWPAIKQIIAGFQQWGQIIAPIVGAIASLVHGLSQVPGLLQGIVVGFLAFRTLGPIIGGLTSRLGGLSTALGGAGGAGGIGGLIRNNRAGVGIGGVGLLAGGTALQQNAGDSTGSQIGGALATIGGGALTGAAIGSIFPGPGTAIGAGIGAAAGAALAGYNYLVNQNKQATEEAAAAQDKLAAALARTSAARDQQTQGMKAAKDALLQSGGAIDPSVIAGVGDQVSAIPDRLAAGHTEAEVDGVAQAMKNLGQTTEQLSTTILGGQGQFDALTARLNDMGPAGALAAQQLQAIRDNTLGAANNAATAAPLVEQLAASMGNIGNDQVAANITNAFRAIPPDVPVNIHMAGVEGPGGVEDILTQVGAQIEHNRNGEIVLTAPLSAQVLGQLEALGVQIERNRDGTIHVSIPEAEVQRVLGQLGQIGDFYKTVFAQTPALPNFPAPPGPGPANLPGVLLPNVPPRPGGADGMVVPGYAPGHDVVNAVLAPGEGVLIPEAVRGLGGAAGVYGINSRFRSGLSKRYYADGGVEPGLLPGPVGPDTELSVLLQIRDLLAGKGGAAGNPLAATAANTATTATAAKGQGGGAGGATNADGSPARIGPFGTPLKEPGNVAYRLQAAIIQAFGGDPEQIIGLDPDKYFAAGGPGATAGLGGIGGGGANFAAMASALRAFATSGDLSTVSGLGLNANDPVITALTSARNKKKGGLTDDQIAGLVDQVLSPGGYTGVLDDSNTALIKSLQRFREQAQKQQGGFAPTATSTGVPLTQLPTGAPLTGNAQALIAFAQQASGGKYAPASDLADGLADCSGAVSDLVEFLTKGRTGPDRLFTTTNEEAVLKSLGATPGFVPGNLNIGFSATHTAATLPNGVNFESGGGGGGVVYGGPVGALDKQFSKVYSLPTDMSGIALPGGAGMTGAGLPGAAGGQGTPVYVTNWPGQGQPGALPPVAQAAIDAAGQAGIGVIGDIGAASTSAFLTPDDQRQPNASLRDLVAQRNPLAFAQAAGFNVEDFSRFGGQTGDLTTNDGPDHDATGRLFSDTAALTDRTFTALNQQLQAMRDQIVDVIKQMSDKLNEDALQPIIKQALQTGLEDLKSSVSSAIGTALGQAAAPPIADAVRAAIPADSGGGGGDFTTAPFAAAGALGIPMAGGGGVSGGTPGKDSVPAMLMPGEFVLNTGDVARMGGWPTIERMRTRGIRHYATGGGVIGNDTVGAEFFGVSEIPIVSTIVNLLVRVLLKVIGVEIEVRDTLNEMTDNFRSFRGDAFKAFDAQGRLINDTSGLIERSSTSRETAADERIRILKIVIQAIIKYLIEKVIVPLAKAVANALIQAGAGAAGTFAGPGGGAASGFISAIGGAGVDIAAEVGTDYALAYTDVLGDMIAEGLQSQFPDLMTSIFGGGLGAGLLDPLGNMLAAFLGIFTGLIGGGGLGGLATVIPGDTLFGPLTGGSLFDDGGMAEGIGFLPKATMGDELVLSPGDTDVFSRFVAALDRGGFGGSNQTSVHAPITVIGGGRETAEQVEDRLLKLMP